MENDIVLIKYPESINKLDKLKLCSNDIIGGGDLIRIGNFVPLVIGKGIVPQVWIFVKYENEIIEIINLNKTNNKQIKIISDIDNRAILITAENRDIIKAKMIDDDSCVVDYLDLRPIGINIFGNNDELNVANSKFSGNTFAGSKFIIVMP